MFDYIRIQNLANRSTRDEGRYYQKHRQKTMLSLRQAGQSLGWVEKMLIVGVGNANDLDLRELAAMGTEVWLADIDGASVEGALAREGLQGFQSDIQAETLRDMRKRLPTGGQMAVRDSVGQGFRIWIGDAGGNAAAINDFLYRVSLLADRGFNKSDKSACDWKSKRLEALIAALKHLGEKAKVAGDNNAGNIDYVGTDELSEVNCTLERDFFSTRFDLVLSQCVISQILWPVAEAVWSNASIPWQEGETELARGSQAPLYAELARVLENLAWGHLIWGAQRLRPGGIFLVNTDVLWQGVPLYGTDIERLPGLKRFAFQSPGIFCLNSRTEWDWQLDKNTWALVRSYLLQKV